MLCFSNVTDTQQTKESSVLDKELSASEGGDTNTKLDEQHDVKPGVDIRSWRPNSYVARMTGMPSMRGRREHDWDAVRVLKLLPGVWEDDICCEMSIAYIHHIWAQSGYGGTLSPVYQNYDALSYMVFVDTAHLEGMLTR